MDLKTAAERLVVIASSIEALEQEKAAIHESIRSTYPTDTYPAGPWSVTVQRRRALDTAALEAKYPVTTHPHLYAPKLVTDAVKKNIAAVELDAFYVDQKPVVLVK
mgnify:CR=1 FL=1